MKKTGIIFAGLYMYLAFVVTMLPVLMMMAGVSLPPAFDQWLDSNYPGAAVCVFITVTLAFFIAGAVSAVLSPRRSRISAAESIALMKTQMVMRFVQIPGYALTFALGVLFLLTVFTAGFSLFFLILDLASIIITGLFSIPVYSALYRNGLITLKKAAGYSLLSFVFCADVIVSVLCYRQVNALRMKDRKS
ncbi:MAG: hypothetical protein ACSW8K_08750 [bacterium]